MLPGKLVKSGPGGTTRGAPARPPGDLAYLDPWALLYSAPTALLFIFAGYATNISGPLALAGGIQPLGHRRATWTLGAWLPKESTQSDLTLEHRSGPTFCLLRFSATA